MDALDLLLKRKVCRAFKKEPIPKDTLLRLLEIAKHAPSGSNMQPWEVYIAFNEKLDEVRERIDQVKDEEHRSFGLSFSAKVPEKYALRRGELMEAIKPGFLQDGLNLSALLSGSLSFFNAPAAAFLTIHESLIPVRLMDLGSYMTYFMLSAELLGLGSCPIGYIRGVSDVIMDYFGVPKGYVLELAIALGFKDESKMVNQFRSPRADIQDNVTFLE